MLYTLFLATLLAQNNSCSGPDLAVTSARVANVTRNEGLNHYDIAVTVQNVGSGESGGALQFVDVYKNGEKKDAKGVPPLAAGRSYTYTYGYDRAHSAGEGSTTLNFQLDMRSGHDCNSGNDNFRLRF